jgi:hypothetical protein
MTLISTVTVGAGGASAIEFTSIPQTYTDLQLFVSARISATDTPSSAQLVLYPNSSSYPDTSVSFRELQGTGSGASSVSGSGEYIRIGYVPSGLATANTFSNISLYMPNYAGSTAKSFSADGVSENNATAAVQSIIAGLDTSTAALTSLKIEVGRTLVQYSTASLYGILKGSGGATVS